VSEGFTASGRDGSLAKAECLPGPMLAHLPGDSVSIPPVAQGATPPALGRRPGRPAEQRELVKLTIIFASSLPLKSPSGRTAKLDLTEAEVRHRLPGRPMSRSSPGARSLPAVCLAC
jgi:hypothetical protein